MRIAVPGSPFHALFASGALTQLEWVERCASALGADGVVPALADFPRSDGEYLAQLRKVAIDLGLVPFGIDAPALLDPAGTHTERDRALAIASGFGALVVTTRLPPPGEVPPATFVATVALAKQIAREAKARNVTLLVAAHRGTIGSDLAAVKHLTKDVDSAWLRALPRVDERDALGPKERTPAFSADTSDAATLRNGRGWAIVSAHGEPWEAYGELAG